MFLNALTKTTKVAQIGYVDGESTTSVSQVTVHHDNNGAPVAVEMVANGTRTFVPWHRIDFITLD